jgi:hypothetical protein
LNTIYIHLLCDHPPGGTSNNNTGGRYSKVVPPTLVERNMPFKSKSNTMAHYLLPEYTRWQKKKAVKFIINMGKPSPIPQVVFKMLLGSAFPGQVHQF